MRMTSLHSFVACTAVMSNLRVCCQMYQRSSLVDVSGKVSLYLPILWTSLVCCWRRMLLEFRTIQYGVEYGSSQSCGSRGQSSWWISQSDGSLRILIKKVQVIILWVFSSLLYSSAKAWAKGGILRRRGLNS